MILTFARMELLTPHLLEDYLKAVNMDWANMNLPEETGLPNIQSFDFYNSVASVYSSKIEGEDVELDSFVKHKFYHVAYQPDYTKKPDDLFKAYQYAQSHDLSFGNTMNTHKLLSKNLLSPSSRGVLRNSLMFVIDDKDQIAYVACDPKSVEQETKKLFHDMTVLLNNNLSKEETFYYASLIHLLFVKIHPMQDGNGRLARLLEKWFITSKLGAEYWRMKSEKFYYSNLKEYYRTLALAGLEYESLKLDKSIPFLQLLANSISYE